jgi:RNA polymerase sigma-70 factor (ECF subfamily)
MKDFSTLVSSIENDLKAWSLYLTKNPEDAKDLYQDCMIKIYTNSNKFEKDSNIKAWGLTIMRNLFLNNLKKKNRMHTTEISDQVQVSESNASSPLQQIFYKELKAQINKLPKALAQTFNMFTAGFKYHEIADELNIPIGTVKSRINTTRKMLQASLN